MRDMNDPIHPPTQATPPERCPCGYDVRGLPAGTPCPECGTPVALPPIATASSRHIEQLRSGALLVAVGMIVQVVFGFLAGIVGAVLSIAAQSGGQSVPVSGILIVGGVVSVVIGLAIAIGWWKMTATDPERPDAEPLRWALAVRIVAVVQVLFGVVSGAVQVQINAGGAAAAPGQIPPGTLAASLVTGLVSIIWGAIYFGICIQFVHALARIAADDSVLKQTKVYVWLVPLLASVGVLACGLGPLAATILLLIVLFKLRTTLAALRVNPARPG